MDLKEIKSIIDLMTKNQLSEFELEKPEFKIRVKKGSGVEHGVVGMSPMPMMAPLNAPAAGGAPASAASAVPAGNFKDILSPMVGTFYQSPSPDSKPYISVGQEVNEESVVCIIEAMKVMNEIKAEVKGVVTEVLAENGKPVEFGRPLFRVRPS